MILVTRMFVAVSEASSVDMRWQEVERTGGCLEELYETGYGQQVPR
jgi:hypothetical protein